MGIYLSASELSYCGIQNDIPFHINCLNTKGVINGTNLSKDKRKTVKLFQRL